MWRRSSISSASRALRAVRYSGLSLGKWTLFLPASCCEGMSAGASAIGSLHPFFGCSSRGVSLWARILQRGCQGRRVFVRADSITFNQRSKDGSSMRTARPAARSPHPFFELRADPFDMLAPCLHFLDGDGPADPLIAGERRYVFPRRQCPCVGCERLAEVGRKGMCDSSGYSNGSHRVIPQVRGSNI